MIINKQMESAIFLLNKLIKAYGNDSEEAFKFIETLKSIFNDREILFIINFVKEDSERVKELKIDDKELLDVTKQFSSLIEKSNNNKLRNKNGSMFLIAKFEPDSFKLEDKYRVLKEYTKHRKKGKALENNFIAMLSLYDHVSNVMGIIKNLERKRANYIIGYDFYALGLPAFEIRTLVNRD